MNVQLWTTQAAGFTLYWLNIRLFLFIVLSGLSWFSLDKAAGFYGTNKKNFPEGLWASSHKTGMDTSRCVGHVRDHSLAWSVMQQEQNALRRWRISTFNGWRSQKGAGGDGIQRRRVGWLLSLSNKQVEPRLSARLESNTVAQPIKSDRQPHRSAALIFYRLDFIR